MSLVRMLLLVVAAALAAGWSGARADERWLLRGVMDAELWETDDSSALLSRDGGETAPGGDLQLWFAADAHERVRVVAVGRVLGGTAHRPSGTTSTLEQAYVRFTVGPRRRIFLDGGQLPNWLGNASSRYLSRVNPLVGRPLSYTQSFPVGVRLAGAVGRFDYRVGIVDEPLINDHFLPTPDADWRPAVAAGYTPFRGFRVGVYATRGSYLSEAHQATVDPGRSWRDYEQAIGGLDVQFSRRFLEVNADYSRNRYDVPSFDRPLYGSSGFVELKYVIRPRWFAAARASRNTYAKVLDPISGVWPAFVSRFDDYEVGGGFRVNRDMLVKLAYRETDWVEDQYYPNGQALTAQLSYAFDLRDALDRLR